MSFNIIELTKCIFCIALRNINFYLKKINYVFRNLARTPNLLTDDRSYQEIPLFVSPAVHPLTLKQLKLANRHPGTMMAVLRSTKIAVDECQHQFRHRRWNCPVKESTNSGSIFGKILKKGESSFNVGK